MFQGDLTFADLNAAASSIGKIHCLGWHLVGNAKVIGTTSAGGLQDNAIPAGDGFDDGIGGRRQRTDQWMIVRHVVKPCSICPRPFSRALKRFVPINTDEPAISGTSGFGQAVFNIQWNFQIRLNSCRCSFVGIFQSSFCLMLHRYSSRVHGVGVRPAQI